MASIIYMSPNGRKSFVSLGEDTKRAREIFEKRCKELIENRNRELAMTAFVNNDNELHIRWKEDNEWIDEYLYFDEDNNDTYK